MPYPLPSYRVRLPGLADVFQPFPDSARDPAELALYKRDRARLIADSPVPAIVRGSQDLLTRIDDVQDALVTLSVATRLAIPALGPLGGLARTSALAADLLNLANLTRTRQLLTTSRKGSLFRAAAKYRDSYSYRTKRALAGTFLPPTYGEILQALQTSDTLLGVGLSLGGIMGIPADLLSTLIYGGSIEIPTTQFAGLAAVAPTFFAANPWVRFAGLAAGFGLSAILPLNAPIISLPVPPLLGLAEQDTADLQGHPAMIPSATVAEWAADTLSSAPGLFGADQPLSAADHFTASIAQMQAIATLWPFWLTKDFWAPGREYLPLQLTARPVAARYTSTPAGAALRAMNLPPALALPGSPQRITTPELAELARTRTIPGPIGWIYDHPDDPRAEAVAALATQATPLLLGALAGFDNIEGPIPSETLRRALRIAGEREPPVSPAELAQLRQP